MEDGYHHGADDLGPGLLEFAVVADGAQVDYAHNGGNTEGLCLYHALSIRQSRRVANGQFGKRAVEN